MTGKPRRADARRNRERVLAAAQQAFADEGLMVPLDEIARRAGVGAGTVYRHFPTKEALFEAVVVDRIEQMTARARQLSAAGDPGAAFFTLLAHMVDEAELKRDLADAVGGHAPAGALGKPLVEAIGTLLARAQDAGAVRADIGIEDLMAILRGGFSATRDPARLHRTFAVIFDGLRSESIPGPTR